MHLFRLFRIVLDDIVQHIERYVDDIFSVVGPGYFVSVSTLQYLNCFLSYHFLKDVYKLINLHDVLDQLQGVQQHLLVLILKLLLNDELSLKVHYLRLHGFIPQTQINKSNAG